MAASCCGVIFLQNDLNRDLKMKGGLGKVGERSLNKGGVIDERWNKMSWWHDVVWVTNSPYIKVIVPRDHPPVTCLLCTDKSCMNYLDALFIFHL